MIFRRFNKNLIGVSLLLFTLLAVGTALAGDKAKARPPAKAETRETTVLNDALGFIGLPGMSGEEDKDLSTYERARRNQTQSAGDRYSRNPDGSYGRQSSSRANINAALNRRPLSATGYFRRLRGFQQLGRGLAGGLR